MKGSHNVHPDTPAVEDQLGFDTYVNTIAEMIGNPSFNTPFCIGIFGDWGVGKTSFMRQLEKELEKVNTPPLPIPIWFNPWRYEKEEHLIIPFLKTIERGIDSYRGKDQSSKQGVIEALKKAAARIGRASAAFAYGLETECKLGPFGFKLDTAKMADREEALEQRRIQEAASYAQTLSAIYYDIINELKGAVTEDEFRLVVFVEDLDRCLPEKAIELPESIKLFLDIPGYLFVLGVDKKVVQKGIAYHYKHFERQGDADDKERTISPEDYLEKMIQLPIDLPPIEPEHKIGYINSLLDEQSDYRAFGDLIERGVGENPRSLKRFINLLAFTGRLADTIKKTAQDPIVEEHFIPGLYVKWAIIVFRYPDEYSRIKGNPARLLEYQRYALQTETTEMDDTKKPTVKMDDRLKDVLAAKPHFPEDESLVRHFIHLTRVTEIVEKKRTRPAATTTGYRPGDWIPIPKGPFLYGKEKETREIETDYDIDAFPVTQQQYQAFINDNPEYDVPFVDETWAEPYNWKKETRAFPKQLAEHPVVLVSYDDAKAFCKWRTEKEGRTVLLPTELEWEKAARGEDGREYPWGNEFDKEKCNTEESGIGRTTRVTRYPQGRSPYDVHDMAGNVWEWTGSFYDDAKDSYVLRGGSWDNYRFSARCADRSRYAPTNRLLKIGFRCVRTKINPLPFHPFTLCRRRRPQIFGLFSGKTN
jgi:formylglycine-generating enzyme required for sulfatase activity